MDHDRLGRAIVACAVLVFPSMPFARAAFVSVALLVAACSGAPEPTIGPATPAGSAAPAAVAPGAAASGVAGPKFPEVISRGGPVIKSPVVYPILFQDDPNYDHVKAFTMGLTKDPYWSSVASEYGVGPLNARQPIVLAPAPHGEMSSAAIESWLQKKLNDGTFGVPNPETLYAVFLPADVVLVEKDSGGKSCQDFAGYHYEIEARGMRIGYAVIPDCGDVNELSVSASHEYFEWATDPFPDSQPAFNKLTPEYWAWEATMAGELSDLCDFMDRDYVTPPAVGYPVQRQWSNQLSRAGAFPCAPKKDTPYFQAITMPQDTALVPDMTQAVNIDTKAIRIQPGASRTVDVLVYSDRPAQGVSIVAQSFEQMMGAQETTGFTYSLSKSVANAGETIKLTITAPATVAYDFAALSATVGTETHYWPVLVVNDDAAAPSKGIASVRRSQLPQRIKGSYWLGRKLAGRMPLRTIGTAPHVP